MARVQRCNVVLYVDDEDLQHYLSLGYKQTDEMGNVIQESVPSDIGTLQKAYVENAKKIEELESTVAKLTAELTAKPKAEKPAKAVETKKSAKK